MRDAERSIAEIEEIHRIRLDLRDDAQIRDALDRLDDAKREVPKLIAEASDIEPDTSDSRVRTQRTELVDAARELQERLRAAEAKLQTNRATAERAREAKAPIKSAQDQLKVVKREIQVLARTITDAERRQSNASREAENHYRRACDAALRAGIDRDRIADAAYELAEKVTEKRRGWERQKDALQAATRRLKAAQQRLAGAGRNCREAATRYVEADRQE